MGEQVGSASLGTAAGPPALGLDSAPSPWPGYASSSQNFSFTQGSCVGSEEECASQSAAPEQEKGVIDKDLSAWTCVKVCTHGGVHMSVWTCVCDVSELVVTLWGWVICWCAGLGVWVRIHMGMCAEGQMCAHVFCRISEHTPAVWAGVLC